MWRCVHTSTWCRLSLARNVNSIIGGGGGGMYLGITCGLTQPWGILWVSGRGGGVYYRQLICENCKLCEWATSWWGLPFLAGRNSHLYLWWLLLFSLILLIYLLLQSSCCCYYCYYYYYYYYYIPDCKPQLGGPDTKNPKAPAGKTAQ